MANQEHLFLCPYCDHHKRKFYVNIEKNMYKCWVCDTRGLDIYQVIRKHGSFEDVREWRSLTNKVELNDFENMFSEPTEVKEGTVELPKEFLSLTSDSGYLSRRSAINYLRKRGLTKEDILRWKIGYCPDGEYGGRVVVPSFGLSGYANFFVARSYTGDWMRYKNPEANRNIIFNELYLDWSRDIILVEGVFDAIRANRVGTAIPLLGSTLRVESKLFQTIAQSSVRVYLALDEDAGQKSSYIANNLMKYGVTTYVIDTAGYEDVAEMPQYVLEQRKEQATVMTSNNYLFQRIRSL